MGEPSRIDSLRTLGKYTLIEKISDGYLGPVYRSFDQDLDRAVDVRILCDGIRWDDELEDLFMKECEALARLRHPNIAALLEVNTKGNFPFMAMEPLGSRDLKNLIAQKQDMSFETKISIMIQVAEGLGYSHKEGILHRNLCPENIFMAGDGCIKIRDFAIAHILMKHLPHPGVRWGAPIYLSPEQIQHKECTPRSDVFALGVIFYELLTDVHPFYAPDGNKALDNILQDIQIPTFELYPYYHPRIWQILKTCLARNPDDRYGSVDDMLDDFRGLLKEMAEDVQLMLSELQSSFASLRITAEKPKASGDTIRLYNQVQNMLRGIDNTSYSQLDLLITKLLEVYPEIRETACKHNIYDSLLHPKIKPEEQRTSKEESTPIKKAAVFPSQSEEAKDEAPSPENRGAPVVNQGNTSVETPLPEIPEVEASSAAVADTTSDERTGSYTDAAEPQRKTLSSDYSDEGKMEAPVRGIGSEGQVSNSSTMQPEFPETGKAHPLRRKFNRRKFIRIVKPICRLIAAVLIILLVVVAVRSFQLSGAGDALRGAWKNFVLDPLATAKASVLNKTRSGSDADVSMESAEIFGEFDTSQYETALMDEIEDPFPDESLEFPPQDRLDRIAVMIGAGKLESAKAELDRLRRFYPDSPGVAELYEKWEAEATRSVEKELREERLDTARRKEEAWNRQFMNFYSQGKYKEADNVIGLWLGELPQSTRARESRTAVNTIQAKMTACVDAMNASRYRKALQELSAVEKINPSDPNIAGLRKDIESRMTSARGTLTVYRLGDEATLLLDGKRVGDDGEIVGQSIPIGSYEISVEKDGQPVASRRQELSEGQAIALVYDLGQRNIRPMIESDQILIDRRKAMEEVYRFTSEHQHGLLRGSCRGELVLSVYEVMYSPTSGSHGFRIPFKLLKLERDGRTIDLYFISDNERFNEFEFDDEQTAARFYQTWNKLKSLPLP
ncbi:MAG: protein kinase [Acidobacteria bacterium]|nr:protein kinase [Acidobacteriota bacterium]